MKKFITLLFLILLIPFLGTTLGSGTVFFLKNEIKDSFQKLLLGFASGVMIAASVWSLIIPAIDSSEAMGKFAFVPAAIGIALGMAFLFLLDMIIPHLQLKYTNKHWIQYIHNHHTADL